MGTQFWVHTGTVLKRDILSLNFHGTQVPVQGPVSATRVTVLLSFLCSSFSLCPFMGIYIYESWYSAAAKRQCEETGCQPVWNLQSAISSFIHPSGTDRFSPLLLNSPKQWFIMSLKKGDNVHISRGFQNFWGTGKISMSPSLYLQLFLRVSGGMWLCSGHTILRIFLIIYCVYASGQ